MVIEMVGIRENGYKIITNSGDHGGQEVPHFHIHVLGGEKITSKDL
jgi:histidine triad (HIT) family protein